MRDEDAVRERSRTRDICGDNGLIILIFTYLVARQDRWLLNTCIITTAQTTQLCSLLCTALEMVSCELSLQHSQFPQTLLESWRAGEDPLIPAGNTN